MYVLFLFGGATEVAESLPGAPPVISFLLNSLLHQVPQSIQEFIRVVGGNFSLILLRDGQGERLPCLPCGCPFGRDAAGG